MNFDKAFSAAASSSNDTTTTSSSDNDEGGIPFEPNESTEGYAIFGDTAPLVTAITEALGDRAFYDVFDGFDRYNSDLDDFPELVEEASNPTQQEKLDLLYRLAKSTFGDRQGSLNEGYGMGWDTDHSPPKPYDNDDVNHVPYLDVFSDLPAFEHRTLSEDEVDELEAQGIDISNLGVFRDIVGPVIPCFNGESFPLLVEDGDEVLEMGKMLEEMDIENATFCKKNGELQGTPTLGPDTENPSDTEESEADDDTEDTDDSQNDYGKSMEEDELREVLCGDPTLISKHSVKDVKGVLTDITRVRTLRQLLQAEEAQDDRSITERLEQRIRAEDGDDEADEADTSTPQESDDDDTEKSVEDATLEEIVAAYGLSDLEKQGVQYRVESGKADSYTEAAEQL
jgi:hypothetical protein